MHEAWTRLWSEGKVVIPLILKTFATAGGTALLTTCLGLVICWLARDSRWFRGLVLILMILVWSLPGPVIGVGLKETVSFILDTLEKIGLPMQTVEVVLYRGPSPAPIIWRR